MSDRDLIVEVCHDLINRALLCERDGDGDHPTARDCREKEAAIRRMLVTPPPAVGLTAEDRANLLRARRRNKEPCAWPCASYRARRTGRAAKSPWPTADWPSTRFADSASPPPHPQGTG